MTFQVPHTPLIYKTTVSYFNRAFPNSPQIGRETFTHTVAQPWTYVNSTRIHEIATNYWTSGPHTVGQGYGLNIVHIEVATETSTEVSRSWSSTYGASVSASVGYGFFTVNAEGKHSWGTTGDRSFETTIGNSTIFDSVVGDFANPDDYAKLNFTFALLAYNLNRTDNISYLVLNYYIDGAIPYTPVIPASMSGSIGPIIFFGATIAVPVVSLISLRRRDRAKK